MTTKSSVLALPSLGALAIFALTLVPPAPDADADFRIVAAQPIAASASAASMVVAQGRCFNGRCF
jgi:hypothetical protein